MSDTEHRELQEWVRELRPNAIWFLLTLIGSAVAVEIVSWIPYPSVRTIAIGIGLCLNALLIAWLSWLRTEDNKAALHEQEILLRRIEKLRKGSVDTGRLRQQREQPHQQFSGWENSHRNVAEPPSRAKFPSRAESPSPREFEDL